MIRLLVVAALTTLALGDWPLDVWPLPKHVSPLGRTLVSLDKGDFVFELPTGLDKDEASLLQRATNRYRGLFFPAPPRNSGPVYRNNIFESRINGTNPTGVLPLGDYSVPLPGLSLSVARSPSALELGMDESYVLTVPADGSNAKLAAESVWGALRGLETFSQLIKWQSEPEAGYYIHHAPFTVTDEPRFSWRGLLVDSSRHFLDVATIKHIIDVMSYNKMNVLHWHLSDAESFPVESHVFPNLTTFAAFAPSAVYTQADLKSIIAHARDRGVRIVPEFDSPGHTASWGQVFPQLVTKECYDWVRSMYDGRLEWPGWDSVALDVTKDFSYDFAAKLLDEMVPLFPDAYTHIGGDEVRTGCWNASPDMKKWMRENGFAKEEGGAWKYDFAALQGRWMDFVQKHVKSSTGGAKASIVWEEAFDLYPADLHEDTIVNVWENAALLRRAIDAGKRIVQSVGWYLDRQAPTCHGQPCPTNWLWVYTWRDMYRIDPYDPFDGKPTEEQAKLILGGEASSWGESVDAYNFDARVWTRAPAVAERLWSQQDVKDPTKAQPRLSSFQCKMARRGVLAGPSQPSYCDTLPVRAGYDSEEGSGKTWNTVAISLAVATAVLLALNVVQYCRYKSVRNEGSTQYAAIGN